MQAAQLDGLPGLAGPAALAEVSSRDQLLRNPVPKNVAFELLLDENSKVRARIPMRVQIYPHDTTDSIVTTVKNFYGIYDGTASGVSFEDEHGITLIARYENLKNNGTVYVRVIPIQSFGDSCYGGYPTERKRPSLGEPFQMTDGMVPVMDQPSRPSSRLARKRSTSPSNRSLRSASQHKQGSRSGLKSRGSSHAGYPDEEGGLSDSESTYSRKARGDTFASSDISMENILQDGRRKRPKFDSSELPLFAPPQVPLTTSTSSISPQRRSVGQEGAGSPFARPTHRPYNYQQALPSPQSYGHSEYGAQSGRNTVYATPMVPDHAHRVPYSNSGARVSGHGILPTPDPTIASCISDEDVAMQLIRLGDASNFSHGRTSASTLDDAFSGVADAASSTGATSDGEDFSEDEDDLPARRRLDSSPMLPPGAIKRHHKRLDDILPSADSSDHSSDGIDDGIKSEGEEDILYKEFAPKAKKPKSRPTSAKIRAPKPLAKQNKSKSNLATVRKPSDKSTAPVPPLSPSSSRKVSGGSVNFQHQLGADEEDLSTKPRCQRCRKSKKGCDRQRPCGRCKDAGIGIEGCVSEDEGNGRKGRYGRHMGVPVKKNADGVVEDEGHELPPMPGTPLVDADLVDKNKKRKR
ncbi:putative C6 finger domain protein [Penicillium brasilianum]|uniref:Putative C6 finger domain protein n=1 Tax=Penicillium brasilianum TaxID=104259 RepID=A0A1S9RHD2_PENBI|nr:putative C6 finger domain protein [Penicillium brasilianum]